LRKLKKIDVSFISLVDKGANRKRLIFKNCEGAASAIEKTLPIKKYDDEQKMVFCIVYSPDEIDTQGDYAPADVIKEAAYNFMRSARTNNVDKQHDFVPDEGFVAESWLVKENDSVFPEEPLGSWAVGIKVENDETWQLIKSGEITGLSLAGLAVTEEVEKQSDSILEKIRELFHLKNTGAAGDIQNWFFTTNPRQNNEEEKKKNDEVLASLKEKIELLERNDINLTERIAKIENSTPASRQIKREENRSEDKIKIWT
jgi:hypothetical protein